MSIIDNAKEIADLIKKIGDIDLYRKIVELEGQVIELTREKHESDQIRKEFEDALAFKAILSFQAPYYFAEGDQIPYCPHCWESKHVSVHLVQHHQMKGLWECRNCKNPFIGKV